MEYLKVEEAVGPPDLLLHPSVIFEVYFLEREKQRVSGQEGARRIKGRGYCTESGGSSEHYTHAFTTLLPQNIGNQSDTFVTDWKSLPQGI